MLEQVVIDLKGRGEYFPRYMLAVRRIEAAYNVAEFTNGYNAGAMDRLMKTPYYHLFEGAIDEFVDGSYDGSEEKRRKYYP